MSSGNLIGSAVMFSVLAVMFLGFLGYLLRRRYIVMKPACQLYDGLRMHRMTSPENFNRYAPIMNSQQLYDNVVPKIPQPSSIL